MKQPKIFFILTVFILLSQVVGAKAATWQEMLQSNFDIVETFDDLQDWSANGLYPSGSGDSRAYDPALLPKKMDSTPSRWGYWANKYPTAIVGSISNGPFVAGEVVVNGKGAKWEYRRTHVIDGVTYVQLRDPVLGSVGRFAVGDTLIGQTSGATATITGWPKIIANHGTSTWRGNGKSLMMNLGDNDNGAGAMAGLGAQRLGMFFGDGISGKSGYKKLNLFMMVKFSPKFFGKSGSQSDVDYISVFKFLDICSGFTSIKKFGSLDDQASIEKTAQTTTEYGANQSIINLNGGGLSMAGRAVTVENIAVATMTPNSSPVTYYGKVAKSVNMNNNDPLYTTYGNDINKIQPTYAAGEWFGLEIITDIGTPNNSDGSTELFVYDKNGVVKGHYKATGQLKLVKFDHYYNKIVLGGNRRSGTATSSTDGRYWIDDFIVDGTRIAPTYFQLIASATDTTNPTAAITAPTASATVSGITSVSVNATDNVGVTKVEFYVNGALKGSGSAGPFNWDTKALADGTYNLTVKAYDAAGNVGTSAAVAVKVNNVADTTAPVVSIASPTGGSSVSGTVNVSINATDNVAVSKVELYVNGTIYGVVGTSPYNIPWNTSSYAKGTYTLLVKAYDAAGNVAQSGAVSVIVGGGDATPPVVTTFTMPATATSRTVPVTLAATDAVGVTGYLISESSSTPLAGSAGWLATKPTSFTFAGSGARTAYAWAKDAAGNVSAVVSAKVTITLPDATAPTVTAFTMPATAKSLTVPITTFTGSDNIGVTGYMVTQSSTRPSASATGWTSTRPLNLTFSATGVRTAYAWTKDAAGNISAYKSATVIVDGTAPVITSYSPTGGTYYLGATIRITANATDAIAMSQIKVSVNSVLKSTVSGGYISYYWKPTTRGTHVISIAAYDKSGNSAVQYVPVYVK